MTSGGKFIIQTKLLFLLLIAAQNENINALEHSTTEHKNLKQPLEALLDLLEKMKRKMIGEKEGLPGSIILAAAACGYCGTLDGKQRVQLIKYITSFNYPKFYIQGQGILQYWVLTRIQLLKKIFEYCFLL